MVQITDCNPANRTLGFCNENVGSANLQSGTVEFSDYGYVVAPWSVYTFLVVFAVACLGHVAIGIKTKHWWVIWTLGVGCAVEAIGWGGRVLSHQSITWDENLGGFYQYDFNGFIMQVVCTVIAPTFYSAANYVILGKLINATGGLYSILTPRSFAIWFMFADFCCLVVQGAGGGIAGTADTHEGADNGALIMTGGVILQLVITVLFIILLADFIRRYRSHKPATRQFHPLPNKSFMRRDARDARADSMQIGSSGSSAAGVEGSQGYMMQGVGSSPRKAENGMNGLNGSYGFTAAGGLGRAGEMSRKRVWIVVGMLLYTTLLIVIRSVYRSVELTDGWSGPIAINQGLFLGLDAFLMAVLAWSYVLVNPAFFLPRQKL